MTAFERLVRLVSQAECSRLSHESEDWENLINPALGEFHAVTAMTFQTSPESFANCLSCLASAIYAAGYQRALDEAKLPTFVVAEQEED